MINTKNVPLPDQVRGESEEAYSLFLTYYLSQGVGADLLVAENRWREMQDKDEEFEDRIDRLEDK